MYTLMEKKGDNMLHFRRLTESSGNRSVSDMVKSVVRSGRNRGTRARISHILAVRGKADRIINQSIATRLLNPTLKNLDEK